MLTIDDIDNAQTLLTDLTSLVEQQQKVTGEIIDLIKDYADLLLIQVKGERDA